MLQQINWQVALINSLALGPIRVINLLNTNAESASNLIIIIHKWAICFRRNTHNTYWDFDWAPGSASKLSILDTRFFFLSLVCSRHLFVLPNQCSHISIFNHKLIFRYDCHWLCLSFIVRCQDCYSISANVEFTVFFVQMV